MTSPHVAPSLTLTGRPTKARVLSAIRWLFRRDGLSPSHGQIAEIAGIAERRVPRYVRQLARDGVLTHRHGQRRSIEMVDRAAMLSDEEWARSAPYRGASVIWSRKPELAMAYPLEGVGNWGLKMLDDLDDKIAASARPDPAPGSGGHGGTEAESGQAIPERSARPDGEDRQGDA